jgi:phosphoenolpyruvate synthase/pyruvate phosphate dikinase
LRHIILDTKRAFSYNIRTKKRQSEGEHPPDGNGCDGIKGFRFDYRVGTMIAIPGAALAADEITTAAELFSFGTNDPTRPSSGFSRDNVEGVLPCYF